MLVNKINQYLTEVGKNIEQSVAYDVGLLAQWAFNRQFMTDDESSTAGKLRLSGCGKCPRQLAYAYHGFEKNGKEIDSRAKLAFFAGDMVEMIITNLAKVALKKLGGGMLVGTGREQGVVYLSVNGSVIEGHPDGLFVSLEGTFLFECKSMSSFAFKRFEAGDIDNGYMAQVNAYMAALGLNKCILVAYNKDSNVFAEKIIERDDKIVAGLIANMLKVLKSEKDNLPEPPKELEVNEKGFYPWNCLYCGFWGLCRDAERVLIKNAYKLKKKGGKNGTD